MLNSIMQQRLIILWSVLADLLLGRKVLADTGVKLRRLLAEIMGFADTY